MPAIVTRRKIASSNCTFEVIGTTATVSWHVALGEQALLNTV